MQLRKPAIWIATVLPFALWALFAVLGNDSTGLQRHVQETSPKLWVVEALGWFTPVLPMVFGIVLADRLVRDRKLGVAELLDVTPTDRGARLVGKYLGACAATAVPVALVYLVVAVAFVVWREQPAALWWGLATFTVIVLPLLLLAGSLSFLGPQLMPTPAVQGADRRSLVLGRGDRGRKRVPVLRRHRALADDGLPAWGLLRLRQRHHRPGRRRARLPASPADDRHRPAGTRPDPRPGRRHPRGGRRTERPHQRIGAAMQLDIDRVSKTFRGKVRALDDVSLTVPGGILGLLGANGAGKTTLMRLLTGLIRPNSGRITIGGHDMATADGRLAVQRILGYLPQDLGLYPELTAREFLDYVALLKGLDDRPYRRRRVSELLELVRLADAADRKLRGYSGGMRRRVGIAQALLNDPELLVVDEPTAGLDPEERIRFRTVLSQLAERRTVVLSTHIVDDIAQTCTELAVLGRGRLLYRGTVSDLTAYARGRVWSLVTSGPAPPVGTVVAALPQDGATRYRIVAPTRPSADADPVAPTLEDGYIALAQQHRLTAEPAA
jgi:ABC-2 type transport system ATP-binding protein